MSVYHPRPDTTYVRRSQQQGQRTGGGRWLLVGALGAGLLIGGYWVAMHFLHGQASVQRQTPTVFEARQHKRIEEQPEKPAKRSEKPLRSDGRDARTDGEEVFQFYEALPRARLEVDAQPLPVKLAQPVRIIAGTFSSHVRAQRELQRLQQRGFSLTLVTVRKRERTLYQLRSAPLHDRLALIRLRNRLQKAGARVLVVRVQSQP